MRKGLMVLALALACQGGMAQAAACDSTMMALVFLGGSVDPILQGAPDVADRLTRFAEKAVVAEGEAKAEGWPDEAMTPLAALAAAGSVAADQAATLFGPAQAVADQAATLCPGTPMPYFPAP